MEVWPVKRDKFVFSCTPRFGTLTSLKRALLFRLVTLDSQNRLAQDKLEEK